VTAALPPLPARESQWGIVARMFRRNVLAVWGLRVTFALALLAIYAPLIACGVPLLRRTPGGGLESPWVARLFDEITWEQGVDRFFNSLLVTVTLGAVAAGIFALSVRRGARRWRWLRWYAGAALVLGLVQASGLALVRSLPYEDFGRDPERLEELAEHGTRWAERTLRKSDASASLVPPGGAVRTPEALTKLSAAAAAWTRDRDEREATDPRDASAALRRAAERITQAAAARREGAWWTLRTPIPYGHRDQLGGREEQYVRFLDRADHLLGTDIQGRDIFARILYGTRISLTIGIVAVSIYVVIGTILGALAGYFGRRVDLLIMRLVEIVICVPSLFLIMMIVALTEKKSIFLIMVAIGLIGWTGITRLVRGQFLRERSLDYVTAARALGLPTHRIIFRHILPNAFAPVLVAATFGVASAILTENTLSFIGLGDPTVPSWGRVLNDGRDSGYWHLILPPTIAIFLTVTALNLLGDGIRDALDPKLRN
jgi:peptide/nickel transport system permease protein